MTPGAAVALGWISYLGAAVAVVVYFAVLLRRPQWVRLMNGSGLFFTGVALTQAPALLNRPDVFGGAAFPLAVLVVLLLLAVVAQAAAALRNRQAWDGVDRRGSAGGDDPVSAASERRAADRRSGQADPSFDVHDRRQNDRRGGSELAEPIAADPGPPTSAATAPTAGGAEDRLAAELGAAVPARGDRRGDDRRSGESDPSFDVHDRRQADRRSEADFPRTAASAPKPRGPDRRSGAPDPSFEVHDRRQSNRRSSGDENGD
jgi:hypothetical protein